MIMIFPVFLLRPQRYPNCRRMQQVQSSECRLLKLLVATIDMAASSCRFQHLRPTAKNRHSDNNSFRQLLSAVCAAVVVLTAATVMTTSKIWREPLAVSIPSCTVNAFTIPSSSPSPSFNGMPQQRLATSSSSRSRLYGISEWRDKVFDFPGTGDDRRLGTETTGPPKEICILPFPYDDVLLQGETKQLRLYEDRFLKLFDHCMESHEGVVAMGLLADTGIIQTVPLCEIEAFNRLEGFGIFVTIRVVGRAQLVEVLQQTPYLRAVCRELNDNIPPNLELPNLLASNIENHLLLLSSMEAQLAKAPANETDDENSEEAAEMKRRIQVAKLVSSNYSVMRQKRCGAMTLTMPIHGFCQHCRMIASTMI